MTCAQGLLRLLWGGPEVGVLRDCMLYSWQYFSHFSKKHKTRFHSWQATCFCAILLLMLYSRLLLRFLSDTNRLLLHDSWAKELTRVISALYQENCRKFEAYVLTPCIKANATGKFLGHCLFFA